MLLFQRCGREPPGIDQLSDNECTWQRAGALLSLPQQVAKGNKRGGGGNEREQQCRQEAVVCPLLFFSRLWSRPVLVTQLRRTYT